MTMTEPPNITVHQDLPLFRQAVGYTAANTGFSARLIEKDYFCSILLVYLSGASDGRMIFKGGTALAKIHTEFYRLSEDLDYATGRLDVNPDNPGLVDLVRSKLTIPGNPPVDVSPQRLTALRKQVDTRLQPVLRPDDCQAFDLDHAIHIVTAMADRLK